MNPSMTPDEEYSNFKQLLHFFVGQWKINADPTKRENHCFGHRTGQILNSYKDYREYKEFDLDCTLAPGFQMYNRATFINVNDDWINILPVFVRPKTGGEVWKERYEVSTNGIWKKIQEFKPLGGI